MIPIQFKIGIWVKDSLNIVSSGTNNLAPQVAEPNLAHRKWGIPWNEYFLPD